MIRAITLITISGLFTIGAIEIFGPHSDNTQTIVQIIMYLTPTLGLLLNIMKNEQHAQEATSRDNIQIQKLDTVHKDFQGRVDQLLSSTEKTATLVERAARVDDRLSDIKEELKINTELTKKLANGP